MKLEGPKQFLRESLAWGLQEEVGSHRMWFLKAVAHSKGVMARGGCVSIQSGAQGARLVRGHFRDSPIHLYSLLLKHLEENLGFFLSLVQHSKRFLSQEDVLVFYQN